MLEKQRSAAHVQERPKDRGHWAWPRGQNLTSVSRGSG